MIFCFLCLTLWRFAFGKIQLQCTKNVKSELQDHNIKVDIVELSKYYLYPASPYAYDATGKSFSTSHLSVSSLAEFACIFEFQDYIISDSGSIFQSGNSELIKDNQVIFDHPSMCGYAAPKFTPAILATSSWNDQIIQEGAKFKLPDKVNQSDVVIALRTPYDECFNHYSFLGLPMLGHVYTFLSSYLDKAVFHCSEHTAALLNILGVPMGRLIIKSTVHAKRVLLPWIPSWNPLQSAPMKGISGNISQKLTANLLAMNFSIDIHNALKPITITSPSHSKMSVDDLLSADDSFRYIVYCSRGGQHVREVYQENTLLQTISKYLNKSKYRLVVVGSTAAYKGISLMQASWQRFAKIYSKAIVMMGPHGGTFNNMIFTPPDCHVIEFNHFPEETYKIGATVVRTCFVAGHFAKGGSGKFYNIEPNNATSRTTPDIYFEPHMKISHKEVIRTLMQINKDIPTHDLLIDNINLDALTRVYSSGSSSLDIPRPRSIPSR